MMTLRQIVLFAVILALPIICHAQRETGVDTGAVRSSPAYAEILLRKTELQADLEIYSADYTETNPKLLDIRFELEALDREMERLFAVKPAGTSKLTLALGKLMVRKTAIATELNRLNRSYSKDHPEVKRTAKKVEIFESAIKEILR